jgi:hypothetical protein
MRDVLGPGTVLGYCTNVHAGNTLDEIVSQLQTHAVQVKRLVSPDEPLDIGLWVPNSAKGPELWTPPSSDGSFLHAIEQLGLHPFTMNAFPFGDFHGDIVKYDVYKPDWTDDMRVLYSSECAEALVWFVDRGQSGSVSTLPLGWPSKHDKKRIRAAGAQLRTITTNLLHPWVNSGQTALGDRTLTIDLEPEPGCILDTADDVIEFFNRELPDPVHRQHIGICHDICHAAVMFEDQTEVLRRYAEAGIKVNKVQISNAPRVPRDANQNNAISILRRFVEPRYLHQTMIKSDRIERFFDDLPKAFEELGTGRRGLRLLDGEWRVHFHLPIYLDAIGPLQTTQDQIIPAIRAAKRYHDTKFFEVETYAWNVLPEELKTPTLAEGIARELQWVIDNFADDTSP